MVISYFEGQNQGPVDSINSNFGNPVTSEYSPKKRVYNESWANDRADQRAFTDYSKGHANFFNLLIDYNSIQLKS